MHIDFAPARRRSAKWRTPMRTMESHTERAHHPTVRHLAAERAEHILAGQCGRVGHVPEMARIAWQGQRVSEHYQVSYFYSKGLCVHLLCVFVLFIGNKRWRPKSRRRRKVLWCR